MIVLPFAVMAILPFRPFGTALTGTIALKVTATVLFSVTFSVYVLLLLATE